MDILNKKILHINASDTMGGAAKACVRLHEAMVRGGLSSSVLVQRKNSNLESVRSYSWFDEVILSKVRRKVNSFISEKIKVNQGIFSPDGVGKIIIDSNQFREADVVYLHYINSGFLNIDSIIAILECNKPVVWFLHDMWPLTGGCHYSFECQKFKTECGNCSYLKKPSSSDASYYLFNKKKRLKEYRNLTIVSPSNWLKDCSNDSSIFGQKKCINIPNTLDDNIFRIGNVKTSRNSLNLPQNKRIILFGAVDAVRNPYKGWNYLKMAINLLPFSKDELEIVVFGSEGDVIISSELKYDVHFVGYVNDERKLVELYNAVDVFVLPSLADNFPNTLLESLFCGTPCVGFDVGGVKDLINNEVGYLAKALDYQDLAIGIEKVLMRNVNSKNEIVAWTKNRFGEKRVLDCHFNLLKEILK